jgi:crossover junction endodeoxyribonuclease RuvC
MNHSPTVILGIDPGIAITGFGVVADHHGDPRLVEYGVIRTPAEDPLPRRLQALYAELNELLARRRPHAIAIEELFFAKNARTALTVGHARGVALLAAAQSGAHIYQYKPAEVKQAVTGYGNAEKRQIQEMVRLLLGLDDIPRPDDAADALAIALCHFQSVRFHSSFSEFSLPV